jgi:hypothetical protein
MFHVKQMNPLLEKVSNAKSLQYRGNGENDPHGVRLPVGQWPMKPRDDRIEHKALAATHEGTYVDDRLVSGTASRISRRLRQRLSGS